MHCDFWHSFSSSSLKGQKNANCLWHNGFPGPLSLRCHHSPPFHSSIRFFFFFGNWKSLGTSCHVSDRDKNNTHQESEYRFKIICESLYSVFIYILCGNPIFCFKKTTKYIVHPCDLQVHNVWVTAGRLARVFKHLHYAWAPQCVQCLAQSL